MNQKELKKLESAVSRGAKLLDKKSPGWRKKIKISKLDLYSDINCICGQLSDGYAYKFLEELGLSSFNEDDASKYGFMCPSNTDQEEFAKELNRLWKEKLKVKS